MAISAASSVNTAIELHGWFGGTFNPVHRGHVDSALEIFRRFGFNSLQLMPCHRPSHREQPAVSSKQRLHMLTLALQTVPELHVDDRELQRDNLSYTADSLALIRQSYPAPYQHLCWIMGLDSFASFTQWHRWQEILELANIVVMARPGFQLQPQSAEYQLLMQHGCADIQAFKQQSNGLIYPVELTPYPISSSAIRAALANDKNIDHFLHPAVAAYIKTNGLYR